MDIFPNHLIYYTKRLKSKNDILKWICDDLNPAYQIICTCGNKNFLVFKSEMPNSYSICQNCNTVIINYNLRLYPAAACLNQKEIFTKFITEIDNDLFNVYVNFEYSDEFDIIKDKNNITGFNLIVKDIKTMKLYHIINDETA